ncbi:hypothetical protein DL766_006242 [Monosporascus sp. MC13-8B]|uniref:Thioredoxin domain-containing protein n=1 Tax=Monosporascus cannonballus TaxID=155416 RepID=A0ABY0H229_9PEZI|nr:hypothetical protein DL762_006420 [Monosporascus cannonballus]RYO91191.1 hypothetical protein DL763_005061 [Monosporascus cannonballus]RYP27742.1 hypothetical protein DL766_006242 [Monosporascus sp. MC13-8B]
MSATVNVASESQWRGILGSSAITVADFYADWCGPCKMIAPTFESLSTKYSKPGKITFCKVDVDNQQAVASSHQVTAMPTFIIFKGSSELQRVRGADSRSLTDAVEKAVKLAGTSDPGASFRTPGRTLGAGGSGSTPAARTGGRALGGRGRTSFSMFNFFNAILTFFGLYIVSLLSVCLVSFLGGLVTCTVLTPSQFDPYKAAENSDFNVNKPRAPPRLIQVPGQRGGAVRPSGGVRTLADL